MTSAGGILRGAIFALWLILSTPIFSVIALVIWPLPPLIRYRVIGLWPRAMVFAVRVICGIQWRVVGRENLPPPPYVILSRHESAWETQAFLQIFPPVVFVVKRELLWIPFFGWGLATAMSPIPIDRAKGSQALRAILRKGKTRLAAGFCVAIFPEGTRMPSGVFGDYAVGGAALAKAGGVAVVPAALNSGKCWPRGAFIKRPGVVTVSIGPAMDSSSASADELTRRAKEWIELETQKLTAN